MTATYCLLVGLSGIERLSILDALDCPELVHARRRIEPTDRLVIVARDVEREARSIVASSWRQAGRTVDIIPPALALTWRPPVARGALALPPERLRSWDYSHAEVPRQRRHRGDTARECDVCGEAIGGKYALYGDGHWAHSGCLASALADLQLLASIGAAGMAEPRGTATASEGVRRRLRRLTLGGLVRVEAVDGAKTYYRAEVPTIGG